MLGSLKARPTFRRSLVLLHAWQSTPSFGLNSESDFSGKSKRTPAVAFICSATDTLVSMKAAGVNRAMAKSFSMLSGVGPPIPGAAFYLPEDIPCPVDRTPTASIVAVVDYEEIALRRKRQTKRFAESPGNQLHGAAA